MRDCCQQVLGILRRKVIATVANQGQWSLDTASTWLPGHRARRELQLCVFKKCFLTGICKSQKWRTAESAGDPGKC